MHHPYHPVELRQQLLHNATVTVMRVTGPRLGALRSRRLGLLSLSLFVGAGAGLGAVAFRYMIEGLTMVLSGHRDYAGLGHVANPLVPFLGPFFVLLAPVIAGALYGPLVYRFAARRVDTVCTR